MPNLIYDPFLETLEKYAADILKTKDMVLISVVGKRGTGKSYFGRYVRKNGFGQFDKKAISVIDDRVMTLEVLCFIKRRLKIPRNGVDELQPYLMKLPERKKVVFYINNSPADKISRADILLILTTDEDARIKRLQQRYGADSEKFKKYLSSPESVDYNIEHQYTLEACI
jgi:hypothetical protein